MDLLNAYKGIPPGRIIARQLEKTGTSQRQFAGEIGMRYQTLNAIIKGRRDIPEDSCFSLDDALHFDRGFFMLVQAYYKVKRHEEQPRNEGMEPKPVIRKAVFWDIDPQKLDWDRNRDFIIERVMERGNAKEIKQVKDYYDTTCLKPALSTTHD